MSKKVERVQTGMRLERNLVKVLKGLAEYLDLSLGDVWKESLSTPWTESRRSDRLHSKRSNTFERSTASTSEQKTATGWWSKRPTNRKDGDLTDLRTRLAPRPSPFASSKEEGLGSLCSKSLHGVDLHRPAGREIRGRERDDE